MPNKHSADSKLRAILTIHKLLRSGNPHSGHELAKACHTDRRTIVDYIAFMRKELKADILSSRYYGYKYNPEKPYSLLTGLDDTPLGTLNELLAVIRQLQHTKELQGLEKVLLSLEQQVSIVKGNPNPLITFEEAELTGKEYLDKLYQLIHQGVFVRFLYKGFEMSHAEWVIAMPLQLREYNNRWFLIGWAADKTGKIIIQNFPIDRFQSPPAHTIASFEYPKQVDLKAHFKNVVGITKKGRKATVKLKFHDAIRLQYVLTKKIHPSQSTFQDPDDQKTILVMNVICNNELTSKILEFGGDVEILEPDFLREKIKKHLQAALKHYTT